MVRGGMSPGPGWQPREHTHTTRLPGFPLQVGGSDQQGHLAATSPEAPKAAPQNQCPWGGRSFLERVKFSLYSIFPLRPPP